MGIKKSWDQVILLTIAGVSGLVAILDFTAALDNVEWVSRKLTTMTLLLLEMVAIYLVIDRRNKIDDIGDKVNRIPDQIISSLGGARVVTFGVSVQPSFTTTGCIRPSQDHNRLW